MGEWCVRDVLRGYRVCNFNDATHGGVHLHDALTGGNDTPISIASEAEAAQTMRNYAEKNKAFRKIQFEAEVKAWKST